jgi:hypothetical protein
VLVPEFTTKLLERSRSSQGRSATAENAPCLSALGLRKCLAGDCGFFCLGKTKRNLRLDQTTSLFLQQTIAAPFARSGCVFGHEPHHRFCGFSQDRADLRTSSGRRGELWHFRDSARLNAARGLPSVEILV